MSDVTTHPRTPGFGIRSAAAFLAAAAMLGAGAAPSFAASTARPTGPVQSTGEDRELPPDTAEATALRTTLQGIVDAGSSAAVGEVRQDGRTVWRGQAGVADLATGAPVPAHARFRIGSVTKTFVATVVLQLSAERRIGLDDPIERHLPGAVPNGAAITVRQLLNHTSGLYNYTDAPGLDPQDEAQYRSWLAGPRWHTYQPTELLALANGNAPYFPPGQGWHYSNTNYLLAGLLVERITGHSWQREVDRRVIRPLGLHDTTMPGQSPLLPGPHAQGYVKLSTGPVDVTELNPSVMGAAGQGISSAADLNRFTAALLDGRLLRPTEIAEMTRTADAGPGRGYGLGLARFDTPCGVFRGHSGDLPGYSTMVAGTADGRRRLVLSHNPYDRSDPRAAKAAVTAFLTAAACGTGFVRVVR
ncbi:serine hydrolase domain-containing protein [Kitasatospora sp. NPDC057542]|uniref:serine hydrolase domain-containing protein n=1 Tax=Streptomycetaceae TaxID=2062 RepID=UPI001CCA6BBF|nr:serine hydrolase domain-containing protein [Streptomyces sp. LS1784]